MLMFLVSVRGEGSWRRSEQNHEVDNKRYVH